MSAHILLNLLNEFGKTIKMISFAFYHFLAMNLISSFRQEHVRFYLSHDI